MVKETEERSVTDRRDFLKLASLGAVVTGATVVAGGAAQADTTEEQTGSGYRETAHVKTYYDLARF